MRIPFRVSVPSSISFSAWEKGLLALSIVAAASGAFACNGGGGGGGAGGHASETGSSGTGAPTHTARVVTTPARVRYLALDATALYWLSTTSNDGGVTSSSLIEKAARDGSAPMPIWQDAFDAGALASDADSLYVADVGSGSPSTGTVIKIPKAGGAPTTLVPRAMGLYSVAGVAGGHSLAVDDTNVYFLAYATHDDFTNDLGSIMQVPKAGGAVETLAPGHTVTGLGAANGKVYFSTYDSSQNTYLLQGVSASGPATTLDKASCLNPSVVGTTLYCAGPAGLEKLDLASPAPLTLVGKLGNATEAVIVGPDAFLLSPTQNGIFVAPVGGSGQLAAAFSDAGASPTSLVADAGLVAFADRQDGQLRIVTR